MGGLFLFPERSSQTWKTGRQPAGALWFLRISICQSLLKPSSIFQEAVKKIHEAHEVDKGDLGGHAEKAIHLLDEANMEVKSAADYEHTHRK